MHFLVALTTDLRVLGERDGVSALQRVLLSDVSARFAIRGREKNGTKGAEAAEKDVDFG